jgi:hypothetical protein
MSMDESPAFAGEPTWIGASSETNAYADV